MKYRMLQILFSFHMDIKESFDIWRYHDISVILRYTENFDTDHNDMIQYINTDKNTSTPCRVSTQH